MARYRPDYKLKEANEVIANLDNSKESELIVYYINKKDELIDNQTKKIQAYRDWFEALNRFLPNNGKVMR